MRLINEIRQHYNDYPSISKINENLVFTQLSKDFKFKQVTGSDIYKFSKTQTTKSHRHIKNPS